MIQLANVSVGIGTLSPASGPASCGTSITLRVKVTIGGESASVTFKDMNTLTVSTPELTAGAQQLVISNPDGETASLDAAFVAQ